MTHDLQFDVENTQAAQPSLGIGGNLLLSAARRARRRSAFHSGEGLRKTTDISRYDAWRARSLCEQLTSNFDIGRLRDKDVLDLGCGGGELSLELASSAACRSVTGVDIDASAVRRAEFKRVGLKQAARRRLRFAIAADDRRIDLPDATVDTICCFDVLEHIAHPTENVAEWHRILRPGGEVWIWWSPWRGPFGHHVESLIPLPWIHLMFRPSTVFAVCAEIYDEPAFVPRAWDLDPTTGRKRPNKWRTMQSYHPFLNQLSRRGFERIVRESGLTIARRTAQAVGGASGSAGMRIPGARFRAWLPAVDDCFVSFFSYTLVKPTVEARRESHEATSFPTLAAV